MRFRIEFLSSTTDKAYVLARQIDIGEFTLSEKSQLGGMPLTRSLTQPRTLKPDKTPDFSVFAFHLVSSSDVARLSVGQIVELLP